MLAQRLRMEAFKSGIEGEVRPGDRVLEVGGGLCTYSMFAARAGAGRVWSVEGGPVVTVARQVLRENELADRVTLLEGWFPQVEPPEKVDLAIYEDYSARLMDSRSWAVLRHLADASLAPGGRLFPNHARIWVAPVRSPRNLEVVAPFGGGSDALYGVDWTSTRELAANTPVPMPVSPDEVVGEPFMLSDLTLLPPPLARDLGGTATWTFAKGQEIHGLVFWFSLEVGQGVWLTNAPGGEPGSWGHLYLPLERTLVVEEGGTCKARVGFDAGAQGEPGWMHWSAEAGGQRRSAHEFRSVLASSSELERLSPEWRPTLLGSGQAALRVLELADGTRSLATLVRILLEEGLADTLVQAEEVVHRNLSGRAR
jgi:hypothetical protein